MVDGQNGSGTHSASQTAVTIDIMLNFDGHCDGDGVGTCKQAFTLPDTETDKNGLYRIVWRCSHHTETDENTDSH